MSDHSSRFTPFRKRLQQTGGKGQKQPSKYKQNKSLRHFVAMLQHSLILSALRVATRVTTTGLLMQNQRIYCNFRLK